MLLSLLFSAAAAAAPRPNIVFVMTDDHAAHAISAYGSRVNQTPGLDRIAREGMLFRNAFVTNSICTPSRAAILTGLYSHKNGVPVFNRFDGSQPTVAKLLMRFYDPTQGVVQFDDQDARDLRLAELRAHMALVSQEVLLFNATVAENIALGKSGATREEIEAAARAANAHEFILALPQGYETMIGERGARLSGGQRQRLAIARAFIRNAPVLVLDEATSALDSEVEAAIQGQLQLLMKGKTVIAIAHRLSTIAMMDRLVVLDKGRVVETGTHAQLVDAGGIYSQLWHRQSGGFIDADQPEEAAQ